LNSQVFLRKDLRESAATAKVIDERVYEWFANAYCRNIPVFATILQTKAL
jgi:hypothetical protein